MSSSVDMSPEERRNDFKKTYGTPVDFYGKVSGLNVMFIGPRGHGKSTAKKVLTRYSRCAESINYWKDLETKKITNTKLETHEYISHVGSEPIVYNLMDMTGNTSLEVLLSGMFAANVLVLVIAVNDFEETWDDNFLEVLVRMADLFIPPSNIFFVISKMDVAMWDETRYSTIKNGIRKFTTYTNDTIPVDECIWIPICGLTGENINRKSENCPWYKGETFERHLYQLAQMNQDQNDIDDRPCRLSIQTRLRLEDSIVEVTGRLLSGKIELNNAYILLPSKVKVDVITMKSSGVEIETSCPGEILHLRLRRPGENFGRIPLEQASAPGCILSDINEMCPLVREISAMCQVQDELLFQGECLCLQMNDFSMHETRIFGITDLHGQQHDVALPHWYVRLHIWFGYEVPAEESGDMDPPNNIVLRTRDSVRAIGYLENVIISD